VKDVIQFARYVNEFGDIMVVELKLLQFEKVLDVGQISCDEVIHGDYMVAFFYKAVTKVGTQKSCSTCN
jgi:hypothetical protein